MFFERLNSKSTSKKEIEAFYMSVIRPVSKFVEFTGLELLEDITPPEFVARLYLDSDPNCSVFGNLKFFYGEKEFTLQESKTKNPQRAIHRRNCGSFLLHANRAKNTTS